MSKVTLASVGNVIDATTAAATINSNNAAIVAAIENTLSRDGTDPNQMGDSLDMNSNRILNLPSPSSPLEPARLIDLTTLNGGGTINTLPTGGTSSQVLTKNSSTNYDTSWQTPVSSSASSNPLFSGRLTLISGQPVISSDVTSQTLWYAPFSGKTIPTYTAGVWTLKSFTASSTDQVGLALVLGGSSNWAAGSDHDVFGIIDSGTLKIATRLWDAGMYTTESLIPQVSGSTITTGTGANSWFNLSNVDNGTTSQAFANCATIATSNSGDTNFIGKNWGSGNTNTISKVVIYGPNDHAIIGSGSGSLAITIYGSSDGTNWHLITIWRGNDLNAGGSVFTIPVSVTETQAYQYHRVGFDGDATNALRVAQIQFYKRNAAANGRRLTHNDGILVNDAVMTARTSATTTVSVAQYEGIYLGTIHVDTATAGQLSATVSYGQNRTYGVWNYYNRVPLKLQVGSYATVKTYVPDTTQRWNVCESGLTSDAFKGQYIIGVAEEPVRADLYRDVSLNTLVAAASYEAAIGVDTSLNFSGRESSCNIDSIGNPGGSVIGFQPCPVVVLPPYAGNRIIYGLERQGNSGTGIQAASTGPRHALMSIEWRG